MNRRAVRLSHGYDATYRRSLLEACCELCRGLRQRDAGSRPGGLRFGARN